MVSDNETWLVETGDIVIVKKAANTLLSLTEAERAIFCLWVIDYSIRNSGTLNEIEDIYSNAISELNQFARDKQCASLSSITDTTRTLDEEQFCNNYYLLFESACTEIRTLYENI
jgi:hypothetical protein